MSEMSLEEKMILEGETAGKARAIIRRIIELEIAVKKFFEKGESRDSILDFLEESKSDYEELERCMKKNIEGCEA